MSELKPDVNHYENGWLFRPVYNDRGVPNCGGRDCPAMVLRHRNDGVAYKRSRWQCGVLTERSGYHVKPPEICEPAIRVMARELIALRRKDAK